jgi:3-hydroxyacyl-CoA dehydrogenase/enoyl-CoA hydratase/3-hydroxybutyryl-CoA epimerase
MVAKQLLGKKTGAGFYTYHGRQPAPNPDALALRPGHDSVPDGLPGRLADKMSEEATLCLEEGISATGDDLDLAMILGTGYPPFRGGPLHHRNHPLPS